MRESGSVCSNGAHDLRSWAMCCGRGELLPWLTGFLWEPCTGAGGLTQSVPVTRLHQRNVHLSRRNQEV